MWLSVLTEEMRAVINDWENPAFTRPEKVSKQSNSVNASFSVFVDV